MNSQQPERNAILLYDVLVAFEKDQASQVMNGQRIDKISKTKLEEKVHERYVLSNKTTVTQNFSFGKRLKEGEELKPTNSKITFENLGKVIKYILTDLGSYSWPSVKNVLREAGDSYADFIDYKPYEVSNDLERNLQEFRERPLKEYSLPNERLSETLVKIIPTLRKLEDDYHTKFMNLQDAKNTILDMSSTNRKLEKVNNELKESQDRLKKIVDQLESNMSQIKSEADLKEIKKYLSDVKTKGFL